MILFLFLLNIFGVALLTSRIFNLKVGLLAAFLTAISFWSQTLIFSGGKKIFLITIFLTYGLWLGLKIRPKLTLLFLIFIFFLTFLILYHPNFGFWLKHNLSSDPTFVPIIHEYINYCHQALPIWVCRLIYNKPAFFAQRYFLNFLSHFSADSVFMAFRAEDILLTPFFYLGLFTVLLSWQQNLLLVFWIFLYPLIASFTSGFGYFHPALGLALLPIITACGISQAIKLASSKRQK